MGGSAKIKLSYCLLSKVFGNRFSKDLGPRLVAIFSSSRDSEATSKAVGIKYPIALRAIPATVPGFERVIGIGDGSGSHRGQSESRLDR